MGSVQGRREARGGEKETIAPREAGAVEPLNSSQETERKRYIPEIIEIISTRTSGPIG